jgi:O-antigen/teichoic acid export membrane protein
LTAEITSPPASRFPASRISETLRRRAKILFLYLSGQGLVQLLGLAAGFLLLRWLDLSNYAQFSIAFSFQSTFGMLTDMGICATITALVGARVNDPNVIGDYIRSGRHVRNIMMAIISPIALVFFIFIAHQHHWAPFSSTLLFVSILASIYFTGMISYYTAPLLIRRSLSRYYQYQILYAIIRIVATGFLYISKLLNAWTSTWTTAMGLLIQGLLLRRASRQLIVMPPKAKPEITRQMIHYVLPNLPSHIFYALQGQITIFLISIFGDTRNIAEVGGLGRLAQLFLLLTSFNTAVIEPFMARMPKNRVPQSFLTILTIAISICTVICLFGFLTPQIFLWILGPQYANLRQEIGWLLLGSCFSYLCSVIWIMTAARRWIYWSTSWTTIGLIVATQIVFLTQVSINSTLHAILFTTASGAAHLLSMFINAIRGFIQGPRVKIPEAEVATEPAPEEDLLVNP